MRQLFARVNVDKQAAGSAFTALSASGSDDRVAAWKRLKAALDPAGVLTPGRYVPSDRRDEERNRGWFAGLRTVDGPEASEKQPLSERIRTTGP
jgi:hypothetical protein